MVPLAMRVGTNAPLSTAFRREISLVQATGRLKWRTTTDNPAIRHPRGMLTI
jgi:hypothetical protein